MFYCSMSITGFISKLVQEYARNALIYNPIPKPTCEYYELNEYNPFVISKSNMSKLSGMCKVFLVKLTSEILEAIPVLPDYGRKMFGHPSSEIAVNIFLDGLYVVTRNGSGFELTPKDKMFCESYHKKVLETLNIFQGQIKHAIDCSK